MYPLMISIVGAVLLAFSLAATQPRDMETISQAQADSMAANFWTYRGALVTYQNDNFANTAGFIPLTSLTTPPTNGKHPYGYLPMGYRMVTVGTGTAATNLWSNYFEGGTLYTFSTVPVPATASTPASNLPNGVVDAIANRNGRSMMIGIKQGNGTMKSIFVTNAPPTTGSTFTLPAQAPIPVGALVIVGN